MASPDAPGDPMSHPLSYLDVAGAQAATVEPLLWATIAISVAVTAIIALLLAGGLWRRRAPAPAEGEALPPLERGVDGARWIWIGVGISLVPLFATLVWTVAVLAQVGPLPRNPRVTLDVTANQWWWDVRYDGPQPDQIFHTANEIHVPVGEPVLVRLHGGDVIHSFWVPQLSGKTDAIPGQTNLAWLEADAPGRYRGQCTEFCGLEHAKMAFEVVADTPTAFAAWRRAQLQTAPPPSSASEQQGLEYFQYRCSMCHAVRGTLASSHYGPDLTHLMSRRLIASGKPIPFCLNRLGQFTPRMETKNGRLERAG